MRFIRNILALIGLITVAGAGWGAYRLSTDFSGFDPQAASVYWTMAKKLAETGNPAEATVWKRKVAAGLTFEEVDESIQSVATAMNIKDVGALPLGDQVAAMKGAPWRKLKIYLYCNPLTAAAMIDYSDAYAAYLPCRISLLEDATGALWLYSLDMDMMIHGGKPLPEELRKEAEHVKEIILAVLDRGSKGEF
ncbi:MAG: DUF302 domain-containing protein [Phyllobacteriaceae bacterium]|nr:DUF302 domain-containing protein [Phyllobacteriaceae bacterium]